MYNQEPTVTAWSFENDGSVLNWAGPDNFKSKYSDSIPEWNTYFKNVKNQLEVKVINMIIFMGKHQQFQHLY